MTLPVYKEENIPYRDRMEYEVKLKNIQSKDWADLLTTVCLIFVASAILTLAMFWIYMYFNGKHTTHVVPEYCPHCGEEIKLLDLPRREVAPVKASRIHLPYH